MEDHQELLGESQEQFTDSGGTTPEPDTLARGHHKYGMFSVNRLYSWGLRGSLEDSLNLGAQYGKVWHLPR